MIKPSVQITFKKCKVCYTCITFPITAGQVTRETGQQTRIQSVRTAGMSSTRWPRTQWSCVLCHLTTRWQESLIPDPNRMPVVSKGSIKNVLMQSRDGKTTNVKANRCQCMNNRTYIKVSVQELFYFFKFIIRCKISRQQKKYIAPQYFICLNNIHIISYNIISLLK